jgi:hypothetical protein
MKIPCDVFHVLPEYTNEKRGFVGPMNDHRNQRFERSGFEERLRPHGTSRLEPPNRSGASAERRPSNSKEFAALFQETTYAGDWH